MYNTSKSIEIIIVVLTNRDYVEDDYDGEYYWSVHMKLQRQQQQQKLMEIKNLQRDVTSYRGK